MKFTQQIQKTLVVCFCLALFVVTAASGQETQGIGSGNRSAAAVFYVNVENTASEPDGLSWATAFPDLQSSVDLAATEGGGEVWVAQGTYTSLDSTILTMKAAVMIYGGFSGTESALAERDWNAYPAIIDGEETRRCVIGANNARLDGFTITRGFAENGAAMHNDGVSPTLIHCTFVDNHAEMQGGCIYNFGSSSI